MQTEVDLARKLAELLEPQPMPSIYRVQDSAKGFWERDFRGMPWHPRPFDHNVMAEVREELKRRELFERYVYRLADHCGVFTERGGADRYGDMIDAPLTDQIAAAVEVLKAKK